MDDGDSATTDFLRVEADCRDGRAFWAEAVFFFTVITGLMTSGKIARGTMG